MPTHGTDGEKTQAGQPGKTPAKPQITTSEAYQKTVGVRVYPDEKYEKQLDVNEKKDGYCSAAVLSFVGKDGNTIKFTRYVMPQSSEQCKKMLLAVQDGNRHPNHSLLIKGASYSDKTTASVDVLVLPEDRLDSLLPLFSNSTNAAKSIARQLFDGMYYKYVVMNDLPLHIDTSKIFLRDGVVKIAPYLMHTKRFTELEGKDRESYLTSHFTPPECRSELQNSSSLPVSLDDDNNKEKAIVWGIGAVILAAQMKKSLLPPPPRSNDDASAAEQYDAANIEYHKDTAEFNKQVNFLTSSDETILKECIPDDELRNLLKMCLNKNPDQRATLSQAYAQLYTWKGVSIAPSDNLSSAENTDMQSILSSRYSNLIKQLESLKNDSTRYAIPAALKALEGKKLLNSLFDNISNILISSKEDSCTEAELKIKNELEELKKSNKIPMWDSNTPEGKKINALREKYKNKTPELLLSLLSKVEKPAQYFSGPSLPNNILTEHAKIIENQLTAIIEQSQSSAPPLTNAFEFLKKEHEIWKMVRAIPEVKAAFDREMRDIIKERQKSSTDTLKIEMGKVAATSRDKSNTTPFTTTTSGLFKKAADFTAVQQSKEAEEKKDLI